MRSTNGKTLAASITLAASCSVMLAACGGGETEEALNARAMSAAAAGDTRHACEAASSLVVGMTEQQALAYAVTLALPVKVLRPDVPGHTTTTEFKADRLQITLTNGQVSRAVCG